MNTKNLTTTYMLLTALTSTGVNAGGVLGDLLYDITSSPPVLDPTHPRIKETYPVQQLDVDSIDRIRDIMGIIPVTPAIGCVNWLVIDLTDDYYLVTATDR